MSASHCFSWGKVILEADGVILCGCPRLILFRSVLAMAYKVPKDVESFDGLIISDNG
jgi:hypothetical protein